MLNKRQTHFVSEYLKSGNATAAYKIAYQMQSDEVAAVNASQLLRIPKIKAAIDSVKKEVLEESKVSLERVVKELASIAFADLSSVVDWDGEQLKIKAFSGLNKGDLAALSEISESDTRFGKRRSVKLHNKLTALDALMKHLGGYIKLEDIIDKLSDEQVEEITQKLINRLKKDEK